MEENAAKDDGAADLDPYLRYLLAIIAEKRIMKRGELLTTPMLEPVIRKELKKEGIKVSNKTILERFYQIRARMIDVKTSAYKALYESKSV
jgi:hypothetical protein